jgi:FecR protein
MSHQRIAPLLMLALFLAVCSGQSVRSTRSGLLYFFDGYVFIGEEQVQQKFGRFQEIGEGNVLRTELGRAEVLLTPGVILRVDENSAVRMLSTSLTDTRVELLRGSAVIEVNHEGAANPPDMLIYKDWQVHVQKDSVARIDSQPAQVRVLSGTADVSPFSTSGIVTVKRGEVLPFASVLVAEPAATPASDAFNTWAMNRSSIVSEDNSIAAGITDDPDRVDSSGVALGGFSYFPQTGIPSLGINYPYGLSFWSPYQSWVNPYLSVYPYGLLYRSTPAGTLLFPRPIRISNGTGTIGRPIGPYLPRPSYPLPSRTPAIAAPHAPAPRVIHR